MQTITDMFIDLQTAPWFRHWTTANWWVKCKLGWMYSILSNSTVQLLCTCIQQRDRHFEFSLQLTLHGVDKNSAWNTSSLKGKQSITKQNPYPMSIISYEEKRVPLSSYNRLCLPAATEGEMC